MAVKDAFYVAAKYARGCNSWDYNEKERCGYISYREYDETVYSIQCCKLSDALEKGVWNVDDFSEEFDYLNWDNSWKSMEEFLKDKVGDDGDYVFYVWMRKRGSICFDYNIREVYMYEYGESENAEIYTLVGDVFTQVD